MAKRLAESTYLVLVRHAETDWNNEYRFQGHSDTPLNDAGRATIGSVIEAVRPWEPVAIYSSDLLRAREMADEVGRALGMDITASADLRECNYGNWEGMTEEEIRKEYEAELEQWRSDEAGFARGGGESLEEMQTRSWAELESIADAHAGKAAAVFTHSGPIRGAVCRIFGLGIAERYRIQVDNGSLTVLCRTLKGLWRLVLLNQTVHLGLSVSASSPVASMAPDQPRDAER